MDISTGSWFEYLREEVLTEGLRDIGLPEHVIDFIENAMPNAPEKSKMYAGNQWKQWELNRAYFSRPQGHWVTWMEEHFRDQIQVTTTHLRDNVPEVDARTITPFSTGDPDRKREQYDEETIKQNKMIAFVVQNVKNTIGKPMGAWRKAFMKAVKALSKAGVPSEKVEVVKDHLAATIMSEFRRWWNNYGELFSWLNDEPTNYEMIKGEDNIDQAMHIATEDLQSREDPEQVIHQFDDGSYWYNLNVSNCAVEGERMGHCGGDSRGVLVSLRKREGKRKASSSYITMTYEDESYSYDKEAATLYQIKGRSNDAPPEEMWDHIDWFIKNMNITSVQETGEHSNDYDGFQEMNNYLASQNPRVSFTGAIDEEAIQEAVNEAAGEYEADNSSIGGEVQGPDDHGGEGVYVYMTAACNIQIELGWKGLELRNNEYTPTIAPNDTTRDTRFETIPQNTWGGEARDFNNELDLDEIGYDLPGEGEVEWEVRMLEGAHPRGYEGDMNAPGPQTAVLEIEIRTMEQESADNEEDAAQNMRYFGEQVKENFEDVYEEIHEKIRSKLAEEGYSVRTPYDRERAGMSEMDLDNWKIYQDGPRLEFWFRRGKRHDTAVSNAGGAIGSIPNMIKMWGFDDDREGHIDGLYSKMFGSRPAPGRPPRIENDDLSRNMARNLEKLYSAAEEPSGDQQSLPLGDEYKAPAARLVLAKDSRFIMMPETTLKREQYPAMLLNWKYEIGVDAKSSPEEVEVVKDIVHYFNARPEMVEEAAAETIRSAMENVSALADATKNDVMSGKWVQNTIRDIDSQYGANAASGSDEWAERKIMIAKWIKENFDQMGEVEKWVAWYKFLKPLKGGYFNIARDGDIEMDDNANLGRPESWRRKVKEQMTKLGTYSGTVRDYAGVPVQEPMRGTLGEPRPVGESVESQIERVDKLLQEKDPSYDLRLYSIKIDVSIEKNIGGEVQETQTEIRGIEAVTTVRTVGDTNDVGSNQIGTYEIKFELLGGQSRVKYRDRILIPGLMRIRGLRILRVSPIHRTNTRGTIRTVREALTEMSLPFGGLAGQLGAVRYGSGPLRTPSATVQQVADDWANNGVMDYDRPMANADMQYHEMVNASELFPYMSRVYRNPKDAFDSDYHHFIKYGPQGPVYVAVGKNGRVKITGNEDIVWFAKKSGLEQIPVFFSYQLQV
jgi:hypothetical protein